MPPECFAPKPGGREAEHPAIIFVHPFGEGKISDGDYKGFAFVPICASEYYIR